MPKFYCQHAATNTHTPFAGTEVIAADAAAAAVAYAELAGMASGTVLVVAEVAEQAFTVGGATPTTLPTYV